MIKLPSHIEAIHLNNDDTVEVWVKDGWSYEYGEITTIRFFDSLADALHESRQKRLFKVSTK